jgi:hypothetical protein
MRSIVVIVVAAVIGIAGAWGATQMEFRHTENPVPNPEANANDPQVEVVGSEMYDFKTMQLGETKRHAFVFFNTGGAPLQLTAGQPSCKCTIAEIKGGPLMPGDKREIEVTWTPKMAEEKFRQMAPIHTNDPTRPVVELKIGGRVRESYKMEPTTVSLGQFSPTETNTFEIKAWGFQDVPWKFEKFSCVEGDTASHFQLAARDMTQEEVAELAGARDGQVLKLTVLPGLSLGNIGQRLKIAFNAAQAGEVDLQITGKAVGDITVLGTELDDDRGTVELGNLRVGQGRKAKLSLIVKGKHRDDVQLKIKSIDPETSLRATLGEPKPLGKTVKWPIEIEIPADAEPVNRLGSEIGRLARVELETGTPDVPDFTLKVRFAITPDE